MRARARLGYTLVELMMIVAIIGISVLVFTPGFSRAMADRRVSLATREVIRIGRRARADTFGYLRAHLMWFDPVNRRVQLLRGPNNSCTLITNWQTIQGDCGTGPANNQQRCVENLWLSDLAGPGRQISIYETSAAGAYDAANGRALCFQPNGVMMYGLGNNPNVALASDNVASNGGINGGFVFSLFEGNASSISGSSSVRIHRVLFPMGGGSPRALR